MRTATCLADAKRRKLEMRKREAWWKIMWYEHPQPMLALATEPQKAAMNAFADWKGKITLDMLRHEAVATMLEEVASKQADKEKAAAGKAATLKRVSWMHEGPAVGLGRQHKMSKVAQGWAPLATASGRASDMPSLDEEDIDDDADLVPFADMEEGGDDDDDDDDDEGEACKSHCGWKKDYNELVDDFYDSEDDELLVDDIEFDSDDDDKDIPADGTEVGVIPEEEDCRKKRCSFEEVVSTWDKGETW